MLFGKAHSVAVRVGLVLATAGVTLAGVLAAAGGGAAGWWDWPPRPSSAFGVACGLLGGLIVLFEMAILVRKWLRGRRLGPTKLWMQLHVWLGLFCLPVILVHSGFGLGGPLSAVTLALFLAVITSGVWGLIMQQWLPQKLLADVPSETIISQADHLSGHYAEEARRLVAGLVEPDNEGPYRATPPGGRTQAGPVVTGQTAHDLTAFVETALVPYLRGAGTGSPLTSRSETERQFARFRALTPPEARPALDRLEEFCDLRRQWDLSIRLNFWLHNWVLIHLPLSVLMTGLMALHAVRALKYW